MIRLLLVDDHASAREPLAMLLGREADLEVVAQAGTLEEARACLKSGAEVDVALVDLDLPDGHGADLVRDLRRAKREAMAVVLTGSFERRDHARAIEAGAAGVLHKSVPTAQVVDAIRRARAGEPLIPTQELVKLLRLAGERRTQDDLARRAFERLTPRERDILGSLADGLGDKAIAERLSVSEKTVRNHMTRLLDELGVESRLQALILAIRYGAVRVD